MAGTIADGPAHRRGDATAGVDRTGAGRPTDDDEAGEAMNRLIHSTSPYLRQHAGNPVDWQEWGDEAFAEARRRDVPILLSVGYAACHWCQVSDGYGGLRVVLQKPPFYGTSSAAACRE